MRLHDISIQIKLFIAVAFVVAISVGPLAIYFLNEQVERETESLRRRAVGVARLMAYQVAPALDEGITPLVMEALASGKEDAAFQYGVVFDKNKNLVALHGLDFVTDVGQGWVLAAPSEDAEPLRVEAASDPGVEHVELMDDVLQISYPLRLEKRTVGSIVATFSTRSIAQAAEAARDRALLYVSAVAAFALGIAFIIGRGMTRALDGLLHAVTAVARGDLDVRVIRAGEDELARLAAGFNDMAGALADAARQQKEFLAYLTHELRSPLNSIEGFAELVLECEDTLTESGRKNLELVMSSAQRMRGMVNMILDLSRLEAGRAEVDYSVFSLPELLTEVVDSARVQAQKDVEVRLQAEPDVASLLSDKEKVRQIFTNLVTNAVKFTPRGSVVVDVRRVDECHFGIEVRDTGIGIPSHMHAQVFEAFRQVRQSGVEGRGSSGLGLSIVRRLVDLLGGTITLESEEGRGSNFRVILPDRSVT